MYTKHRHHARKAWVKTLDRPLPSLWSHISAWQWPTVIYSPCSVLIPRVDLSAEKNLIQWKCYIFSLRLAVQELSFLSGFQCALVRLKTPETRRSKKDDLPRPLLSYSYCHSLPMQVLGRHLPMYCRWLRVDPNKTMGPVNFSFLFRICSRV